MRRSGRARRLLTRARHVRQFMLITMKSPSEAVALEACEFWTAYCETKRTDMALLAKYLPQLVPQLLKGMMYRWVRAHAASRSS